jgi:poly-beta-1,6-N-acetyl-D-glucosamine synthase
MRLLFWGSTVIVAYIYLGYPAWLLLRNRWSQKQVHRAPFTPSISIVMVVRNEEKVADRKLQNLLHLNYPQDLVELVVVSDGSSDGTTEILSQYGDQTRIKVIVHAEPHGKAAGLNDAIQAARGEIVVFTDARQKIESDSVRQLAGNFADPAVGCVSGELMLGDPDSGEAGQGMGLYWRIEKRIRELESASGSVMGASGALYAVRRNLLPVLPPETILDDVLIPLHVLRQGWRVIFDPRARAWDTPNQGRVREFARKVRTLSGNYQLMQLAPWILTAANPARFRFISHKLLRLLSPFALAAMLIASFFLPQPIYRIALIVQLIIYALSLVAMSRLARGPVARVADAAFTFVTLNTAAVVAFANFVTGRKVVWTR